MTSSVPELKPHGTVIEVDGLADKVDSNGGGALVIKDVKDKSVNNAGFPHRLVAEEHHFMFRKVHRLRVTRIVL